MNTFLLGLIAGSLVGGLFIMNQHLNHISQSLLTLTQIQERSK